VTGTHTGAVNNAAAEQPEPADGPPDLPYGALAPAPKDEVPPLPAEPPVDDAGRRYPSTIGGAFYLAILAVVAVALGVVTTGAWRTGVRWYGGALLAAALLRAVLPAKDAGMLAVRKRWWDCLLLAGTGVALIFLAGSIPDQPL
jgi:predicted cobalt transporter CbtA